MSTSDSPQTTQKTHKRPHLLGRSSHEDKNSSPNNLKPAPSSKPSPRRSSWISSLSSKFSSGTSSPTRHGSTNGTSTTPPDTPEPQSKDSGVQFNNPFGGPTGWKKGDEKKKEDDKPITPTHVPRRPSVLVQAGKEREEHTGFLSNAFRKFSSGNVGLGKGSGSGQPAQRRIMNIDQNRPRVKISDLDASKLRRVAFCVDVEVAGHASWHEVEEYEAELKELQKAQTPPEPAPARKQSFSLTDRTGQKSKKDKKEKKEKKDVKEAAQKDKAEGAALKSAQAAQEQIEEKETEEQPPEPVPEPFPEPVSEPAPAEAEVTKVEHAEEAKPEADGIAGETQPQPIPGAKKKEKKKRSEAERKERKERKRRLAEQNGQVPLELNVNPDDDDDLGSSPSPPGSLTPSMSLSPTTDPLRIYKRCAQLRETTPVKSISDQISSHSPTLAEAPGTVAILDLTGSVLTLSELATLADWLAVVPVRKLVMEDCQLTDEGVRMILCGLSSCKTADQARRNRKLHKPNGHTHGEESLGVIEKVSLKGNSRITKMGWKHIALFLHISKSVRALDLSGIPFPDDELVKVGSRASSESGSDATLGTILSKALSARFGKDRLEELIFSNCSISHSAIGSIVDAALQCKLRRLGLANNNVNGEGLEHIVRYVESGVCEGLDLGDNNLHNCLKPLSESLTKENSFFAVSLSGCNLAPSDLKILLPSLALLPNFRFIDLSHNKGLFSTQPNAVPILRKYLPQLTALKRIHLNDCGMSSEHAVALADILPECPVLAHISILENGPILELMHAKDSASQEEACALFVAIMTATRVSHTLVAVEIEVPSGDSNEVVKALASQVVAYTLRNLEQCTLPDVQKAIAKAPDKDAPEILLHIVGEMEGYQEKLDVDEPAPDEDYLLGGNAIVKALGVCLGTAEERKVKTTDSGRGTPMLGPQGQNRKPDHQPRDMSKQLLQSARKIRMRLKPALVHEDRAGNDMNYRKSSLLSCFIYF